MKSLIYLFLGLFLIGVVSLQAKAQKLDKFYIYKEAGYKTKFVPSGYMGDYENIRMQQRCFKNPKKGLSCLKIKYYKRSNKEGWAGVYWQYPYDNWGNKEEFIDLRGYSKLTFYARGNKGGEVIECFKVGGIKGEYSDSIEASLGHLVILSKRWKKYTINLKGKDLSHMIGGFCFVVVNEDFQENMIFYLDEIFFS